MTQQDEEAMMKFFLRAFDEVVIPVLDQINGKLDEHTGILNEHSIILDQHTKMLDQHTRMLDQHTRMLDELTEKVDSHTGSFMELEKLPKLIGELNGDIQVVKLRQQKLEDRFKLNG